MDTQDFIFLIFSHKCLITNNSNLGTYGSGNLLTCGQLPRDMSLGAGFALGCPHANSRSPSGYRHGRVTMGRNVRVLTGVGTRRSCCVVLGALVLYAGENTLGVAANATAGSDRLRRNSSAGTTRKHVDRASLRSRMRLHRLTPQKLVGSFHGCGFQVP